MITHSDDGPDFGPDDPLAVIMRPPADYLGPPMRPLRGDPPGCGTSPAAARRGRGRRGVCRRRSRRAAAAVGRAAVTRVPGAPAGAAARERSVGRALDVGVAEACQPPSPGVRPFFPDHGAEHRARSHRADRLVRPRPHSVADTHLRHGPAVRRQDPGRPHSVEGGPAVEVRGGCPWAERDKGSGRWAGAGGCGSRRGQGDGLWRAWGPGWRFVACGEAGWWLDACVGFRAPARFRSTRPR